MDTKSRVEAVLERMGRSSNCRVQAEVGRTSSVASFRIGRRQNCQMCQEEPNPYQEAVEFLDWKDKQSDC